jgi:hypothetical protein
MPQQEYRHTHVHLCIHAQTRTHTHAHAHAHTTHIRTIIIRLIIVYADAVHACVRPLSIAGVALHAVVSAAARWRSSLAHAFAVELAGTLQRICVAESTSALTAQSPNLHATSSALPKQRSTQTNQRKGVGCAAVGPGFCLAVRNGLSGLSERIVTSGCIGMQRTFNSPHQQAQWLNTRAHTRSRTGTHGRAQAGTHARTHARMHTGGQARTQTHAQPCAYAPQG